MVLKELMDYRAEKKLKLIAKWDNKDPQKAIEYSNPLEWWEQRQTLYPTLAALARRILCIPATSAPCERLFSVAGMAIRDDRTRMLPEHADSVLFICENWEQVEEWLRQNTTDEK